MQSANLSPSERGGGSGYASKSTYALSHFDSNDLKFMNSGRTGKSGGGGGLLQSD